MCCDSIGSQRLGGHRVEICGSQVGTLVGSARVELEGLRWMSGSSSFAGLCHRGDESSLRESLWPQGSGVAVG